MFGRDSGFRGLGSSYKGFGGSVSARVGLQEYQGL